MKSPFKWAGGKRKLAPLIKKLYEPYRDRVFVEPFTGGGSVFLDVEPRQALLNDANIYLIWAWKWLKMGGERKITTPKNEQEYYLLREQFNSFYENDCDPLWMGEAFWIMNRLGFNGLSRFNSKGDFNVPAGYKTVNGKKVFNTLPDLDTSSYAHFLKNYEFDHYCYSSLLEERIEWDKEDQKFFLYCDPPYYKTFTGYNGVNFTWEHQVDLAERLSSLDLPIVLSNSYEPELVDLYTCLGFDVQGIDGVRNNALNCKADGRSQVKEILATKNI